jgi:hypothetical protein
MVGARAYLPGSGAMCLVEHEPSLAGCPDVAMYTIGIPYRLYECLPTVPGYACGSTRDNDAQNPRGDALALSVRRLFWIGNQQPYSAI